MASDGKPFYRTEHVLRTIGGEDNEYIVWSFEYEDVFDEGYKLKVKCQIPAALEEGLYQACSSRRLKDVEFFLRRRFPDGQLLETRIAGIIDAVERDVGGEPGKGRTYDMFTITIVPALEQLKLDQKGGTWHKKSHADILFEELKKGLEPYGRTVRRELSGDYPPIDFTVRQPHETLYEFALKLMERTGINFYFDHGSGVEQLVLCDTNDKLPDINRRGSKPFRPQWDAPMGTDNEEWITNMNRVAAMVPAQVEFLGFDVTSHPQIPVVGLADIAGMFSSIFGALGGLLGGLGGALGGMLGGLGGGGGGGGGKAIPGKISHNELFRVNELEPEKQFKDRAKLHSEVEGNRASPFDGNTNITGAIAGRAMEVEVTPGELKKFIVTKVKASGEKLGDGGTDYTNTMTAVPTTSESGQELQLRPTRAKKEAKHFGIYRAKVIAIENDPLDVDQFLRVRLEFPWDKQDDTPKETYVSMLQPMAGTHSGTQWLPRAGDRVLVTFVGGNAEQPVILGSIYDNELKPPVMGPGSLQLPESRSWLGWTYASVGDKSRLSQCNIDTRAGQEMYFFNAPFDWQRIVGNDSKDEIERDEIRKVKRNFEEKVDGNYKHEVGGNRDEKVKGNYSLLIDGSGVIEAKQGLSATIGGSMSNNFKAGVTSTVDRQLSENINGLRATRATGPITFSSASSFVARAPTVAISAGGGGGMGAAAGGALDLTQDATLAAPRSSALKAGGSHVKADLQGAHLHGAAIALEDELGGKARLEAGKLVVDAPQGIVFRCGTNTLELAPDGLRINGMRVVMDAPQVELRTAAFDIVGPEDGKA